ncbi:MAG: GHMP kinase [Acidobacteria bacterium]|nr:GHMP kinase [Acidobacteriota bacterium]
MPAIIRAKAPLRISFAGGGTDVPPFPEREGGCILSATINKYSYGALKPRADRRIQIESVDFGLALNFEGHEELVYDGKLDLVKAAINKLTRTDGLGFDLLLHGDVPPGSGLGSSSTTMVVLVGLMREFTAQPLTDYEIAHLAYVLEREELQIKGGLQDHYAATFGGFNFMEFFPERVIVNPLKISQDVINELEHNLLLCYTGTTRLSDRLIDDQVQRYERGELPSLTGLRMQKELAIAMKNALLQRRLREFGELLDTAWQYKKMISQKISTPEVEEIYAHAKKHGAIGGKLSGAGGGGFMMLYSEFEQRHRLASALAKMGKQVMGIAFDPYGLQSWRVTQ